jgi:four helix bundle protein
MAKSYGSVCELDTQLLIANKLGFIKEEDYLVLLKQLNEIQKMTYSLCKSKSINM